MIKVMLTKFRADPDRSYQTSDNSQPPSLEEQISTLENNNKKIMGQIRHYTNMIKSINKRIEQLT